MPNSQFADELGVGMAFLSNWSFEVQEGSIGELSGIACLGRDIAYAMQLEVEAERGVALDANAREDVRIAVRSVLRGEGRVAQFSNPEVNRADDTTNEVEVTVGITAETGEQGTFIVSV